MNFYVAILILQKEENTQHFQHITLYYFKKGKNAAETQKKICAVYGEGAVTNQTCQKWFGKFRGRDFSLDDAPRSGIALRPHAPKPTRHLTVLITEAATQRLGGPTWPSSHGAFQFLVQEVHCLCAHCLSQQGPPRAGLPCL